MANFTNLSRYTGGQFTTNRTGQNFVVLRKPLNLEKSDGDRFVVVTKTFEKRPDILSFEVYGTAELWWVIYEFNGIRDPMFQLQEGQTLRVPALGRVIEAISALEE